MGKRERDEEERFQAYLRQREAIRTVDLGHTPTRMIAMSLRQHSNEGESYRVKVDGRTVTVTYSYTTPAGMNKGVTVSGTADDIGWKLMRSLASQDTRALEGVINELKVAWGSDNVSQRSEEVSEEGRMVDGVFMESYPSRTSRPVVEREDAKPVRPRVVVESRVPVKEMELEGRPKSVEETRTRVDELVKQLNAGGRVVQTGWTHTDQHNEMWTKFARQVLWGLGVRERLGGTGTMYVRDTADALSDERDVQRWYDYIGDGDNKRNVSILSIDTGGDLTEMVRQYARGKGMKPKTRGGRKPPAVEVREQAVTPPARPPREKLPAVSGYAGFNHLDALMNNRPKKGSGSAYLKGSEKKRKRRK